MPHNFYGVDDESLKELEALFSDDVQQENSPTATDDTEPGKVESKPVDQTKAFAKRLAEEKAKAVNEERESIAKSLGYNSFDELQKSRERKTFEDKGLDPDEVSPIVEELVNQRINNDPRMKELEAYRAKQVEEFGKRELADITKLTGGEITKLEQLPKEVIDLWKTKGSLKAAYLELKGEELILKARNEQNKGSTSHLSSAAGTAGADGKTRPLTQEEKKLWKFFNPNMTDEELNKKLVSK